LPMPDVSSMPNEHLHDLTGGLLHARSKQAARSTNSKIHILFCSYCFHSHFPTAFKYSYALALVPSPFFLTQYSLDVMSDKSNSRSRKFRVLSSGSPLGYVNCIVTQSVLFEQMTTMLMFTLLTFTNVDV
jgi:hypothetical protein